MPQPSFFTRILDPVPAAERLELATEQIQHAERVGLARAWVAQHHFHYREGGLPSPFPFLANVAAKTSTIRLATGVITLPLEKNAIRVAEDAVVADILSGGRIDLGIGSGSTPASFATLGLDPALKHEYYERDLEVLLAALAGDDLGGGNHLYPAAGDLRQRVWQATFSTSGSASAGRNGNGLLLSRTQPRPPGRPDATLAELQNPIIDTYLENLPDGVAPRITASRTVFIADDREEAFALARAGIERTRGFFELRGRDVDDSSPAALARTADVFVGTADDVAEALAAETTLERVDEVTVQVHSIDPPHELILRHLELYATEVAPQLGWTNRPVATLTGGH